MSRCFGLLKLFIAVLSMSAFFSLPVLTALAHNFRSLRVLNPDTVPPVSGG